MMTPKQSHYASILSTSTIGIATLVACTSTFNLSLITNAYAAEAPIIQSRQVSTKVSALGRIEPRNGVIRIAGPPHSSVVIKQLLVKEGDTVEKNKIIAILAGVDVQRAEIEKLKSQLADAQDKLERNTKLHTLKTVSDATWHSLNLKKDIANAALKRARARLELLKVRAPITGQILEIHARESERVGKKGIVEIGETTTMYVVAEVNETDISRIKIGQKVIIHSPTLPHELAGKAERIALKFRKKYLQNTGENSKDNKVIEVKIRILKSKLAANLTNLQVKVVFQ